MSDTVKTESRTTITSRDAGAIYTIGVLGAWVYFWQQADGFWWHVWAIVQGILWPAFMVYDAFSALN